MSRIFSFEEENPILESAMFLGEGSEMEVHDDLELELEGLDLELEGLEFEEEADCTLEEDFDLDFEVEEPVNESFEGLAEILAEGMEVRHESNKVVMDKQTLRKRLLTQATLLACKDSGDKLYTKYLKAAKAKKHYRQLIQAKYEAKGQQKLKAFLAAQKAARR